MKHRLLLLLVFLIVLSTSSFSQSTDTIIDPDDPTFALVEKESEFPGGREAWAKFLMDNLEYPPKAVRKGIQGTVVLQFIVDKDGRVIWYEAISGPPLLQKAALNLIRKSPSWIPAQQSGKNVKSYKKQPILFKL